MSTSTSESKSPRTTLNTGSWWIGLVNAIRRRAARIRHQRQIRRDMKRLMEYSDRELADIGLHRSDVWRAVRYGRTWE